MSKPFNEAVFKEVSRAAFQDDCIKMSKELKEYTDFVKSEGFPGIAIAKGEIILNPDHLVLMVANGFFSKVDFDEETAKRMSTPAVNLSVRKEKSKQLEKFLVANGYMDESMEVSYSRP